MFNVRIPANLSDFGYQKFVHYNYIVVVARVVADKSYRNNMSGKSDVPITQKYPRCIATISAGFEKGDFLVREEKGQRVYFDFFEEAFNYIAAKGYSRMPKGEEGEWMDLMVSNVLVEGVSN